MAREARESGWVPGALTAMTRNGHSHDFVISKFRKCLQGYQGMLGTRLPSVQSTMPGTSMPQMQAVKLLSCA